MTAAATSNGRHWGVVAEFDSAAAIYAAAKKVTDAGYRRVDSHTPFPIHGIDHALKQGPSHLGWLVVLGGIAGIIGAQAMMYWMNAVDYPLIVSGKPGYAWPSTIPITFELMVLLSAFCAVFGMFGLNGLPRLHHPIFKHGTFHRASDDRFFLSVEAKDPMFDPRKTVELLTEVGGKNVELIEE
jgi:hypothetical protein